MYTVVQPTMDSLNSEMQSNAGNERWRDSTQNLTFLFSLCFSRVGVCALCDSNTSKGSSTEVMVSFDTLPPCSESLLQFLTVLKYGYSDPKGSDGSVCQLRLFLWCVRFLGRFRKTKSDNFGKLWVYILSCRWLTNRTSPLQEWNTS